MQQFKISCSAIGKIMAGRIGLTEIQEAKLNELETRKNDATAKPLTANMQEELKQLIFKRDNPELPEGVKTYCKEWFLSKKYNRKKEWFSKYAEKGLAVESTAIEMLSIHLNEGVKLEKNTTRYFNEFVEGEYDTEYEDTIFDTKSVWDIFTFPFFDKEIPNKDYWWQLQGYMDITNKTKASLVYCLIDTPKPLIELELKKLYYASGGHAEDWTPEKFMHLEENYKFNHIPFNERIKLFNFERDQISIDNIHNRVKMCRKFIETLSV